MMKGRSRALFLSLSLSKKLVSSIRLSQQVYASTKSVPLSTYPSTCVSKKDKDQPTQSKRDERLLEKFRQRKLQGRVGSTQNTPPISSSGLSSDRVLRKSEDRLQNDKRGEHPSEEVLSGFEELGLREGLIGALLEMGVSVSAPSEIQCVGIPAILEGKNLVLSSDSGADRSLAYLVPLVQLLQRDETLSHMKPEHPRAIVLCNTDEQSDEGFHMAKFISHHARLKPSKETSSGQSRSQKELPNAPIGMLVGTPGEVLQFMEEGSVILDDVKYLVFDEADTMLACGLGPEINGIVNPLKKRALKANSHGLQTLLITSTITKMLGDQLSPLMERLERNHAGKVAAAVLELEQMEVFDLLESLDALKKKVAEAMNSLHTDGQDLDT